MLDRADETLQSAPLFPTKRPLFDQALGHQQVDMLVKQYRLFPSLPSAADDHDERATRKAARARKTLPDDSIPSSGFLAARLGDNSRFEPTRFPQSPEAESAGRSAKAMILEGIEVSVVRVGSCL